MIHKILKLFKKKEKIRDINLLLNELNALVSQADIVLNICPDIKDHTIRHPLCGYGFEPNKQESEFAFRALYALESLRDEIQIRTQKRTITNNLKRVLQ